MVLHYWNQGCLAIKGRRKMFELTNVNIFHIFEKTLVILDECQIAPSFKVLVVQRKSTIDLQF